MKQAEGTQVETVIYCPICEEPGKQLYIGLKDRLVRSHEGVWGFHRCTACGHVWLSPRFTRDSIHLAYKGYSDQMWGKDQPFSTGKLKRLVKEAYFGQEYGYDVNNGCSHRFLGNIVRFYPSLRVKLDRQVSFLPAQDGGKLLDIGSGSGWFLQNMQSLGWKVEGVDIDPVSAEKAKKRGVHVCVGTLEQQGYPDASFDAITLRHVIEHLHDPVHTLQECYRILSPHGYFVIITPNVESNGHEHYKENWMPLEPPRHLNLFSLRSMALLFNKIGFRVEKLYTSWHGSLGSWVLSSQISKFGYYQPKRCTTTQDRWRVFISYLFARLRSIGIDNKGEEIIAIVRK